MTEEQVVKKWGIEAYSKYEGYLIHLVYLCIYCGFKILGVVLLLIFKLGKNKNKKR